MEFNRELLIKLNKVQTSVKCDKGLFNKFGGYKYRNAEQILEAVKPFLAEQGLVLLISDEVVNIGDRFYVKATASVHFGADKFETSALAREPEEKKGMDGSQITGTASSYARKYALNGLFLLDDTKDEDSEELKTEKDAKAKAEATNRVKSLKALLAKEGIKEETICALYKVKALEDVTDSQYKNIVNNIEKIKEKQNEGKN